MADESIYNLIPKEAPPEDKAPQYRSQHPKSGAPAMDAAHLSVFGAASQKKSFAGLGRPPGDARQQPTQFLRKKRQPLAISKPGSKPKKFVRKDVGARKAALPSKDEAPVLGVRSRKNFITKNAVDAILMKAKKKEEEEPEWTHKEDYGQVPAYLQDVKHEVKKEYDLVAKMQEEDEELELQQSGLRELTEEEKSEILVGLKKNFDEVNHTYLSLPVAIDTEVKRRRKEALEEQIAQLEKDIERMSRAHVFVQE